MSGASVAVVGGGVIGASVAYHLGVRGVGDVVVLDRGVGPGEGSTGRATGGFRAQFASAINVRLSLLALENLVRDRLLFLHPPSAACAECDEARGSTV